MKYLKLFTLTFISFLLVSSCVSRKEIVYFQGLDKASAALEENQNKGLRIKHNDLLTISVSAPEQEAAMPFNLPVIGMPQGGSLDGSLSAQGRQQLQTYLVDSEGNIEFPVLTFVAIMRRASANR